MKAWSVELSVSPPCRMGSGCEKDVVGLSEACIGVGDVFAGVELVQMGVRASKHSERWVQEDGHEMHAMGGRVSDVGWSLAALAPGLRSDGSVMADVERGDGGMGGGMHVDRNDVGSRMEDLVPVVGIGVG